MHIKCSYKNPQHLSLLPFCCLNDLNSDFPIADWRSDLCPRPWLKKKNSATCRWRTEHYTACAIGATSNSSLVYCDNGVRKSITEQKWMNNCFAFTVQKEKKEKKIKKIRKALRSCKNQTVYLYQFLILWNLTSEWICFFTVQCEYYNIFNILNYSVHHYQKAETINMSVSWKLHTSKKDE